MPRHLRRSRSAARPSSANGGSSTAPSPTAWKRLENACSPSFACRRANGAVYAPQMQSSVCTKNLSDGSRPKLFCHPPTPPRCCSGRCSLQDRSTCARWMVGRRSPQNPLISRLTLPPETIPSCYRRMRHTEFQPHSGRHLPKTTFPLNFCGLASPHELLFPRWGGVGMLHYRAYLLDEHRHVISAANLYCADEQAAKERAQQLVDVNDVELWQLDRRIAVFKSHPRPSSEY